MTRQRSKPMLSRRRLLFGSAAIIGMSGFAFVFRKRIKRRLSMWTRLDSFAAAPPLIAHDAARDKRTLYISQQAGPAGNIDVVLEKMGGIGTVVGVDDVVIIKVSAQWWNQGMTNVAAVKRTVEHILERPGFRGEIILFENVHFRLQDGSGLARAWTHASERNVDVEGWTKLGDLVTHFANLDAPVSFVGLVDAGESALARDHWHDPAHTHGVYGGDGRGPVTPKEERDGYVWDFDDAFRKKRSWVDYAQTPTTYPIFSSPRTGIVVDFKRGLRERAAGTSKPVSRKLTWINMTTANEHAATGFTGACKSTMGIVDMSAGRFGTDPRAAGFQSVHYFGSPTAKWRMAGPLAHFAKNVRAPDLILTVAEWVGATPAGPIGEAWDDNVVDLRMSANAAFHKQTVIAGTDPVAIDVWCARNLLMPIAGARKRLYNLDDEGSRLVKFLRYYREILGAGTLDAKLVDIV